MSLRYVVEIDDDDRDQCPDSPWTATVRAPGFPESLAAGVGSTPKRAALDIDWAEVAIADERRP